ncbi:MAG: hypothetical protein PW843_13980 [Azospirillaceae bacterium]|nr:hypothetical protein [Azospirillaceae bacterium]
MPWLHLVAYFFGGAFLSNAVPHFVAGTLGRPFQSPFAKPPGRGLSSSRVNVLWGWANLMVAYLLTLHVGDFRLADGGHAAAFGAGLLAIGLLSAHHFGPLHGGDLKDAGNA